MTNRSFKSFSTFKSIHGIFVTYCQNKDMADFLNLKSELGPPILNKVDGSKVFKRTGISTVISWNLILLQMAWKFISIPMYGYVMESLLFLDVPIAVHI